VNSTFTLGNPSEERELESEQPEILKPVRVPLEFPVTLPTPPRIGATLNLPHDDADCADIPAVIASKTFWSNFSGFLPKYSEQEKVNKSKEKRSDFLDAIDLQIQLNII